MQQIDPNRTDLLAYTFEEMVQMINRRYGKGRGLAAAVFGGLYAGVRPHPARSPDIRVPESLQSALQQDYGESWGTMRVGRRRNGTTALATRLDDDLTIESVLLSLKTHKTLCVSSQAGCRMGCRFCETGRQGLKRNLRVAEIVGQVVNARRLFGPDIRNVVFMGMGEPLDNFDNVIQAIRVMSDQRGLDIAPRYITLATAGLLDGIRRLEGLNVGRFRLTVSLNAPNDSIRSALMPVNDKYPMAALKACLQSFPLKKKDMIMITYVLVAGINDRRRHARQLAAYIRPLPVKLNLIPLNPGHWSTYAPPAEEDVARFIEILRQEKIQVQRRATRGRSLMAACGQLGATGYQRVIRDVRAERAQL